MARDPNIERRMLNWMRWKQGAGSIGLGYGSASIWNRVQVDHSPNRASVVPTNAIEGDETNDAINALPQHLKETVHVFYLCDDRIELKARALGCGVSTVHARIGEAHRLITVWFSDKTRAAAAHREREEAVQAAARAARMAGAQQVVIAPAVAAPRRVHKNGPVTIVRPAVDKK